MGLLKRTPIPKIDLKPVDDPGRNIPEAPTRKKFTDTAFGRTILGKNKTGEIVHGLIDVLPVPNIHEVVKRVVKDADAQAIDASYGDVFLEALKRLDWARTGIALVASVIILKASDWLGIESGELFEMFRRVVELMQ